MHKKFLPLYVTCSLFALLFAAGAVQFENFGSLRVFMNLFTDNAFLIIAAIGMTFVILSGGIDLSVGSTIALSGVIISVLMQNYGWHPLPAFALVLVLGTLFGASMGAIIHYYQLQPFIVTLAGMFFARGLSSVISEESVPIMHSFYDDVAMFGFELPGGAWLGSSTIIALVVLALAIWLANFTRLGGRVYGLGGDAQSAALMGVPIARTTISVYALSSFMAALAGIVFSFYTFSGYSLAAVGVELDAIAAVVIGGTLLTGGYGYVLGTLFGVLIMGVVQTYISFDGTLSSWWTKIVIGLLLFVFIALQRYLVGRGQKSR
ncbi:galactofuranose ABC transporter, permease protein YjfF [Gilvimarinus algae]|uniref:Galactofuranose ABC transporter, permease protein YjfF n=1 Tax=Gilvimarinus algae TaxID=3058037 RepID=A0ABT8TDA5_9GAMM|nr:galactofuranose ABC transporter, permease protein YjfF [Gilvimarinus sp. SDUM040014]MDO3381118.1 galactofuranose ABC transporter, permease protein YjfF [Gilvimarinus sp. SDUM040014]